MKFKITLKDPDGFYNGIYHSVEDDIVELNLDDDEKEAMIEIRTEKLDQFLNQCVEHGEYITLEFDTEAKTATILNRK